MTPNVVILTLDHTTAQALSRTLGMRASAGAVIIREVSGRLGAAIEAARRDHGSLPVGVAARSRAEALEAIEAGADEAMAIAADDRAQVLELLDRTRLRGSVQAELERERRDVAQADKLASLGTLVAGVAHEVNNPLSAIVLLLDLLPNEDDSTSEIANELRRSVGLIQDVVKDLRVFARDGETDEQRVLSIPETLDHILRLIGSELRATATVERDFSTDLPEVLVSETRLTQVLTNVLVNATHAMRETERPSHRLRIVARGDEHNVILSVQDTGPGIPPDAIDRIFDPFFTTKRERFGTGLGLSISRNLMRKMGGDLLVESVYGEGATFILILPRPRPQELREARLRSGVIRAHPTSGERRSVLVVTDDDTLLRAYGRVLGRVYDMILAGDPPEAIALLASGSHAEAVVVDLAGNDATVLAAWLTSERPTLSKQMVLVTDDPEMVRRHDAIQAIAPRIVLKPAPAGNLVSAIEGVLSK